MNAPLSNARPPTADLDRLLVELRPKLHRYCSRMTGSVIDGEDAVQDAMAKALQAAPDLAALGNPEGWLFRIAQNAAHDIMRRRARRAEVALDEQDAIAPHAVAASTSLRAFLALPPAQRSAVVLMDVLGYSLAEICEIEGASLASVKAALHRGRARLRRLAEPGAVISPLTTVELGLLRGYVDRFNAGDFDGLRDMLADEVRLELVNHVSMAGRSDVGSYFGNYERGSPVRLTLGAVDGRPAALAMEPEASEPAYFILLGWAGDRVSAIRDFRYARYAMEGADLAYSAGSGSFTTS
ncbi:MAG: sigma-70 family RNA polymerase sigma factor [Phenylobacterium sp.]|uniref:sigma-70 family RNA polymerase sigma factor n=1 Tax=Phenylobacterium sp. TaxID=1871053 RepID=UPI002736946D|nr:sigma-70 family RNA polymerase sigma factor [Phenylobacterium sp.]MDP3749427.1 sigma-70 family RNA polymerase sigma factor [Phenylobacterium sp.]